MKKNNKGFTLIELLAVIVILGLLMAIAIPSVTRYITQSRRKTLVSSIESYITSVMTEVNDGQYHFSDSSKVFAIPIDCVSLEKGGTNPFGNWKPVTDSYWAYVLVQYDSENYNYIYGFTFKDDAGYGLYPTSHANIEESGSQIKTGYDDLNKPTNGTIAGIVDYSKWDGFKVTNDTQLVVLEGNGNGLCEMPKPAIVISGTGTEVGDMIRIGTEKFYVIENNASTITMLAQYQINPDLENPVQNSSANGIAFSNTNYWKVSSYPAYVYDENSNLYQYVEAYEKYLQKLGADSASASLISLEQLEALGCTIEGEHLRYSMNWIGIASKRYWTATAVNSNQLWALYGGGIYTTSEYNKYNYITLIRPTITISKSEIDFNP